MLTKQNKVGNTVISQYDYTVNAIGQRTDVAQTGTAFQAVRGIAWGYDSLGQVIKSDHSTDNAFDRAYQYDTIGNRIEARDGVTVVTGTANYTANSLNQYTAVGSLIPVHDFDGNMTTGPLPANPAANSTLVWDGENRLVSTTVGTTATTRLYDSQSRRIAETTGGNTTLFVYDGFNCIAEYSGTTLAKTRTWGLDLSGSLQGAGGVGGLLVENQGASKFYPTFDGNGNVSEYLDSTGAVAEHFEYDPFGNTVVNTDSVGQFSYRFSTKPLDFTTGLYYYAYRYYDPQTGRWPSRDPIGEEGGINLYAFVGNNGVNRSDRLGMHPIDDCSDAYSNCLSGCPMGSDPAMMVLGQNCRDRCAKDLESCRVNAVGDDFSPLPSNSPECCKYKKSDEYANTSARCFCKCAGDSDWSNYVRGCLRKAYEGGASPHNAHMACYAAASAKGYDRPEATLAKCLIKCWDYNPFN